MAREDRHLSIIARRNRGVTTSHLSHYLYAATGTRVSKYSCTLFQKDFMRARCLPEDVMFASRSRLRTGESI
ncbi:hypothetical protein TNCV_2813501 [Trichonephila clavipes]|nr:hypothetical protein TNCV_2813501 [Trichonephila clavipes]